MRLLPRRVPYLPRHDVAAVLRTLAAARAEAADAPRIAIVDVEPMIAEWNTDQRALDAGLRAFLDAVARREELAGCGIVFATNARRRPSRLPARPGQRLGYLAHAGKPLRTARFRELAGPGVVVGDQIATDGLLAWRLGYSFVHFIPCGLVLPRGPRVMRALGRPLRRLLFRPARGA